MGDEAVVWVHMGDEAVVWVVLVVVHISCSDGGQTVS